MVCCQGTWLRTSKRNNYPSDICLKTSDLRIKEKQLAYVYQPLQKQGTVQPKIEILSQFTNLKVPNLYAFLFFCAT